MLGGDKAAPRMGLGPAPSARIEYGANTVTLELVASMDEAINHIHAHGSAHTDAIITGAPLLTVSLSRDHVAWRELGGHKRMGTQQCVSRSQ